MKLNLFVLFILLISQISDVTCQALRILPLGNSLTKGVFCLNNTVYECSIPSDAEIIGYRYLLYNSLSLEGYTFDFVGPEISGWLVFPDYNHAGYSGYLSMQLANKLNDNNNYILNITNPDIILLEIGTNDVFGGSTDIAGVRSILNEVDEFETSSGKTVLVFLSKIINFRQGTQNENLVSTFNTNLYNLYASRKAAGDIIELVDIGADIVYLQEPQGDMKDELHPNQVGYDKMALRWFNAIHSINTAPVATQIPDQTTVQGTAFPLINLDNYINDAEDADQFITWTIQPSPQYFTITVDGNRQATIIPKNPNWKGSENITFVATDRGRIIAGLKKSASITVTFTVNVLNHPPSITIPADRDTYVEDYFELKLTAMDIDEGDDLIITTPVLPEWLHFDTQTTTLYGIAESQHIGDNPVKVTVNDQLVAVDSNFIISVFPKSDLDDVDLENRIFIYPNPASNYITLTFIESQKQPLLFRLYSVTGTLIISEWIRGEVVELDLRKYNIPSGAYLYDIGGTGFPAKGKLMIISH